MRRARGKSCIKSSGFSMVETVMTLAIGLILASVAMPLVVSAVQSYRLNSVTQQTANLIDLARYSAIRRNAVVSLLSTAQNGNTVLYVDLNGNGTLDANEPLVMLPNDMQIANGQPLTPDSSSMHISGGTQDFAGKISFDYRGTVNFSNGGAVTPYFLAIGYTNQAQYGARAVTVSAMGQTKMWTAPSSGTWTGM